ncbi:MAG: type II toxin-antitoxin system RelE/ParE family toxin [Eubacteriales bacterium]
MDKYAVKLLSRAYRDLEGIYAYIADTLLESGTAQKLLDALEETIFSLEELPQRGATQG